ncbi:Protein viaA [Gossypium arboreum]|uniref:Protein viaA n=1 Tax=Gossypium arboreum TaxID=29729 RepID=A0A0B0NGB4_GOSAR|nr:Protein viaA [Gossypium arboreum]
MGRCLLFLQSWALYRMSLLASVSHQPYVFPLVNRWSIYPGIGRLYTVPIYRLMIEQHAEEGVGEVHGINKRGKHGQHWGVMHRRFVAVWENWMARRPQMDISSNLRPSLEYIQWYSSMGKPYLLGGQSIIIPSHVQRSRAYEPVADIESDPQPNPELDPEPEAESERSYSYSANTSYHPNFQSNDYLPGSSSHSHSADTSYHPDLPGNDYFPGSSGGGYHYGLDIFGSYPPQHNTSSGLYPPYYSTTLTPIHCSTPLLLGCIHRSMALLPAQTPSPGTEEDVGRRNHP